MMRTAPASAPALLVALALGACTADDVAHGEGDSSEGDGSEGELAEDEDDVDAFDLDRPGSETRRGPGGRKVLAAGSWHACVARRDGTVRCWGKGTEGELGNGASTTSNTPVVVSGLTNVVAVGVGSSTSVALRSDGTVWRWGTRWGQAGDPENATPVQIAGLSGVIAVDAGNTHGCAVKSDGHVWCWGAGTLGDGVTSESDAPVEVSGISNAIAVDAGWPDNTCALLATGTVKCWGDNSDGQLGDGSFIDRTTPITVPGLANVVGISTDASTTCAALADGTLRCWGSNAGGLLGSGDLSDDDSPVPVQVVGITNAEEVDVGGLQHACAILVDGTARCWGRNDAGQLGDGNGGYGTSAATPVAVSGLDDVVALSAGSGSCALRSDGTARCWGAGVNGNLGNGGWDNSDLPVTVSNLGSANDGPRIAAGPAHTCALRNNGTVKCWGDNEWGQLGNGNQVDQSTPTTVAMLNGVRDLAAGGDHTCALRDTGTVSCWGRNVAGELGDGGASGAMSLSPVPVSGLTDAVQIAASQQSTCAIESGGSVVCWGDNQYGQLGSGDWNDSDVPVPVAGLTNAVAIDMNNIHVCALTAGGNVRCWGHNFYGQLGNGDSGAGTDTNVPSTVTTGGFFDFPLANAVAIGVGNTHSCAVISNGTVRCWGSGFNGALGHGSWDSESYPVAVSNVSDAVDVSLGSSSTCALRWNGGARCWGSNTYGELGHGAGPATNVSQLVGLFPFFLSNAIAIDSGFDSTCVAKGDGTMACWGLNGDGQLGDGTSTNRTTPVSVIAFP